VSELKMALSHIYDQLLFAARLMPVAQLSYPYKVIVQRRDNEGFGFVIISSVNKNGSTIGKMRANVVIKGLFVCAFMYFCHPLFGWHCFRSI